jgi:hypothetical protein
MQDKEHISIAVKAWLKEKYLKKMWLAKELDLQFTTISKRFRVHNWTKLEIDRMVYLGLKLDDNGQTT